MLNIGIFALYDPTRRALAPVGQALLYPNPVCL